MPTKSFEEKLKELRNLFISTLPIYIESLTIIWSQLQERWDQENCRKCIFELHSLKGSSGTLGYDEISQALGDCEKTLKELDENNHSPNEPTLTKLKQQFLLVEKSKRALLEKGKSPTERHTIGVPTTGIRNTTIQPGDIKILVVDDEDSTGNLLQKQLSEFGFDTTYVKSLVSAKNHVQNSSVELVILDLIMPDTPASKILQFAAELEANNIRAFVAANEDSFELRLGAVNANISNFIIKPYQITNLVAKVRSALLLDLVRPYKVLLIDDQESVASYFKSTLEQHQMEVKVLLDASKTLEALIEFDPDIFLLDLYMPKINGLELAKIIRLMEKYDSIPIVFLTSENTIQTKLDILECGCDDVLSKSIAPDILIRQIMSRLKRGKKLRYLNSRDSLTGLLNHGQIMEAAENALQLGERRGTTTIMAMIDLDHFKVVNDSYGHASGDKVLIGLAQLLLQHVRQTDHIGRYGGEEFLLVFPDSSLDAITQKMNNIRQILSSIQFKHEKINFSVTLSGGITSSDSFHSLAEILVSADKSLYKAKSKGRNNIQLAP